MIKSSWTSLVGGFNPSEKTLVSWDDYSQYVEKYNSCSKSPTRSCSTVRLHIFPWWTPRLAGRPSGNCPRSTGCPRPAPSHPKKGPRRRNRWAPHAGLGGQGDLGSADDGPILIYPINNNNALFSILIIHYFNIDNGIMDLFYLWK